MLPATLITACVLLLRRPSTFGRRVALVLPLVGLAWSAAGIDVAPGGGCRCAVAVDAP